MVSARIDNTPRNLRIRYRFHRCAPARQTGQHEMNQLHLMVDIETASRAQNAAILSIGACIFDPSLEPTNLITKEWRIQAESNMEFDRDFSQDTLNWWAEQGQEARTIAFSGTIPLKQALTELYTFGINTGKIWPCYPDFDVNILTDACEACYVPWNFPFWSRLSVRTIKWLAYPTGDAPKINTIAHSALDDAVFQAELVCNCYAKLKNT